MRVHVVGNACVDTVFNVQRFPMPGETLNAVRHSEGIGGKGANQAVAAARTGVPVTLWTCLGTDGRGEWIAAELARDVDLEAVRRDGPTDQSTVMVAADGQNAIVSGVACISTFQPVEETALAGRVATGDFILLQGNMTASATDACLRLARTAGATGVLNASPVGDAGRRPDLSLADLIVVNGDEAAALTADDQPLCAARKLAVGGRGAAIVTLGADGCIVVSRAVEDNVPARAVDAVDTSGAGDVFCGSLVGFLARGLDVPDAARLATEAAAIAVTRPGTLASCPTAAEMRAIIGRSEVA